MPFLVPESHHVADALFDRIIRYLSIAAHDRDALVEVIPLIIAQWFHVQLFAGGDAFWIEVQNGTPSSSSVGFGVGGT